MKKVMVQHKNRRLILIWKDKAGGFFFAWSVSEADNETHLTHTKEKQRLQREMWMKSPLKYCAYHSGFISAQTKKQGDTIEQPPAI